MPHVPAVPPNSPVLFMANFPVLHEQNTLDALAPLPNVRPEPNQPSPRFKCISETWDEKAYKYIIANSADQPSNQDAFDDCAFVSRTRVDRKTHEPTFFIDVKSTGLRDSLQEVLRDVRDICLREDKPTIDRHILYNCLPALEGIESNASNYEEIKVLIDFLTVSYLSTTKRLTALFDAEEITYDLLWTLFRPNTTVYTTCIGSGKPRCVRYVSGEEKSTSNGLEYFCLDCVYVDYDGKILGEATTQLGVQKFRGTKKIHSLESFPLSWHPDRDRVAKYLMTCGQKFLSLQGVHHRQYHGNAFYMKKGQPMRMPVHGRVMVDAQYFEEANPNHCKPQVEQSVPSRSFIPGMCYVWTDEDMKSKSARVKSNGTTDVHVSGEDLLLCSPTVPGFSYAKKMWVELAVADLHDISWNELAFTKLALPQRQKDVIQAMTEAHVNRGGENLFDDFVVGKGMGLIILLHGLPGLGKTLTAEGIAEYLKRPLYVISAGELGTTPEKLESQLPLIFERAERWNAILLLDEAEVFLEQRSSQNVLRNALVAVFLRELEYYRGIMILTTNRVKEIDDAIASRIHLPLRYKSLVYDTRKKIWEGFLAKATTSAGPASLRSSEVDILAKRELNGRQIKNIVSTAHALASRKGTSLGMTHLETAITAGDEFAADFRGAGCVENLAAYA